MLNAGEIHSNFPTYVEQQFSNAKRDAAVICFLGTLFMLSAIPLYAVGMTKEIGGAIVAGTLVEMMGVAILIPGAVHSGKSGARLEKIQRYNRRHEL